MKICLDAGHYGKYNQSPANKDYYESEAMWKLHLLQKKYLEEYGHEVILTRSDIKNNRELYTRGTASKGCDLFISNHSNAVGSSGTNESIDYPVVFVSVNGKGNALGEKLASCVEKTMGTTQKGRIATKAGSNGDYYGVIRGAVAVGTIGILIEHSFHTNTRATNWLLDEANLDKLAKAEADVINEHFAGDNESDSTVKFDIFGTKTADIDGFIKDGTTYIKARQLLETMGFKVGWDDAAKTVLVSLKN